jgi:hypothetical protein
VTATSRWTQVAVLPDGHWLFSPSDGPGRVAITDGTNGDDPDHAYSQVLWLDFERHPLLSKTYGSIPLINDDGRLHSTPADPVTVIALSLRFDWAMNVRGTLVKAVKAS